MTLHASGFPQHANDPFCTLRLSNLLTCASLKIQFCCGQCPDRFW